MNIGVGDYLDSIKWRNEDDIQERGLRLKSENARSFGSGGALWSQTARINTEKYITRPRDVMNQKISAMRTDQIQYHSTLLPVSIREENKGYLDTNMKFNRIYPAYNNNHITTTREQLLLGVSDSQSAFTDAHRGSRQYAAALYPRNPFLDQELHSNARHWSVPLECYE